MNTSVEPTEYGLGMLGLISLTKQLSEETCIPGLSKDACIPWHRHAWVAPGAARITLPNVSSGSRPLADILQERRAVRAYHPRPIDQGSLGTLLRVAWEGDLKDWPEERPYDALEFVVVAWRVERTPPAMYLYEPEKHTLAWLADAPDQYTQGDELVLQPEFAKASAIVLIIGALSAALERHGSWGHQNLLFRAGAAGQRMWLASLVAGLVGTVFAGFLPRATQRLIDVDGYHRAGLFAYAMGAACE